jgi:DNA invertase Pin-like site-specific DNA recombinase
MTETHPQNRGLGYARVSTCGQTLDAQLEQLRGAGCTKICREKVTGVHNDRRQLLKMLNTLTPGDVVTVTRIDRLARSKIRQVSQAAIVDNKQLGAALAFIRDQQLRREPERRSGPRRRDQHDARLFKVG